MKSKSMKVFLSFSLDLDLIEYELMVRNREHINISDIASSYLQN